MYYLYVLFCNERRSFYVGSTRDLRRRIAEHKRGDVFTTRNSTWRLVYYEAYLTEKAARNREKRLKNHGRSKQLLLKRILESLE